jgi:hypothetical protein
MCGAAYERCDDVRVCESCLKALKPPIDSADIRDWDDHLALIGNGTSRGACVGESKIAYENELPTPRQSSGDDANDDPPGFLEAIVDGRPNPETAMLDGELLDWFLRGSSYGVAQRLGLTRDAVQQLRSEFLRVDRAEVEAARITLGYSAEDWQRRKLGLALVKAKAVSMRRSLMAA